MNFSSQSRREVLVLVAVCAFLFVYGLAAFGLLGADEPRYAQVAHEMFDRGDWVTPTLGAKPWLEKPVLYYWEAMLAYRLLGVSDWSARLPGAFSAASLVIGIFVFLRRYRPGSQLDGALMTAASAALIGFGRSASTDMPLAANFGLALLGWFAWQESRERRWLLVSYGFLALATLAKGPVAIFLAGAVVVLFVLAKRDLPLLWKSLSPAGLLLFCAIALPWFIAVQVRNPEFFRVFIMEHNLARFGTNLYRHVQPFWFYLPVALLGFLPWTGFVFAAAWETARQWWRDGRTLLASEDAYDVFLLIWLVVPIAFFSLSRSKLPGYILPAMPAGTLLAASYVQRRIATETAASRLLVAVHSVLSGGIVVPALLISFLLRDRHFPGGVPALIAIGAGLFFAILVFVLLRGRFGLKVLRTATLLPVLIAVAALIRIGAPTLDALQSARSVADALQGPRSDFPAVAVFGVSRQIEYGLNFYANAKSHRQGEVDCRLAAVYDRGEVPESAHLLLAREGTQREIVDKLGPKRRVTYFGKIAHLEYYFVPAAAGR